MKKFGSLVKCFIPMIGMLLGQVLVSFIIMTIKVASFTASHMDDMAAVQEYSVSLATDSSFLLNVIGVFEVAAFIVFALCYFCGYKAKLNTISGHFNWATVGKVIVLFAGAELALSSVLVLINSINPDFMASYNDLMNNTGLTELSVMSTILTLVCAPIVEEIAFRGITLRLADKFTSKFWLANFIQALAFGITHGNLIQGTYAFLLGLLLGYVAKKYKSLWPSIIGHLTFNFCGTYIVALLYGSSDDPAVAKIIIIFVLGALLTAAGFYFVYREKSYVEPVVEAWVSEEAKACEETSFETVALQGETDTISDGLDEKTEE